MPDSAWRRPHGDTVTPEVARIVFERDRECFLHKLDPTHACRDAFGHAHSSFDVSRLTLDHVREKPRIGELTSHFAAKRGAKRAPSDPAHLVAMCALGNVGCPSRDVRDAERAYLAAIHREVAA